MNEPQGSQSPIFLPFQPSRLPPQSKGYFETLDSRKDIERIRHALRREEEHVDDKGNIYWKTSYEYMEMTMEKENAGGGSESEGEGEGEGADTEARGEGSGGLGPLLSSLSYPDAPAYLVENHDGFYIVRAPQPARPLANKLGEHDVVAMLTAFMTTNIKLSSIPGGESQGDRKTFVDRLTNIFAHTLIDFLAVNAMKFEIEDNHIPIIFWLIIPNVYASLQMAVGAGARISGEKILGEQIQHADLTPQQLGVR